MATESNTGKRGPTRPSGAGRRVWVFLAVAVLLAAMGVGIAAAFMRLGKIEDVEPPPEAQTDATGPGATPAPPIEADMDPSRKELAAAVSRLRASMPDPESAAGEKVDEWLKGAEKELSELAKKWEGTATSMKAWQAMALLAIQATGEPKRGKEYAERAIRLMEAVFSRRPKDDWATHLDVMDVLTEQASLMMYMEEKEAVREILTLAMQAGDRVWQDIDKVPENRALAAYRNLGVALNMAGNPAEGDHNMGRAREISSKRLALKAVSASAARDHVDLAEIFASQFGDVKRCQAMLNDLFAAAGRLADPGPLAAAFRIKVQLTLNVDDLAPLTRTLDEMAEKFPAAAWQWEGQVKTVGAVVEMGDAAAVLLLSTRLMERLDRHLKKSSGTAEPRRLIVLELLKAFTFKGRQYSEAAMKILESEMKDYPDARDADRRCYADLAGYRIMMLADKAGEAAAVFEEAMKRVDRIKDPDIALAGRIALYNALVMMHVYAEQLDEARVALERMRRAIGKERRGAEAVLELQKLLDGMGKHEKGGDMPSGATKEG
jgi:hypothetical protein